MHAHRGSWRSPPPSSPCDRGGEARAQVTAADQHQIVPAYLYPDWWNPAQRLVPDVRRDGDDGRALDRDHEPGQRPRSGGEPRLPAGHRPLPRARPARASPTSTRPTAGGPAADRPRRHRRDLRVLPGDRRHLPRRDEQRRRHERLLPGRLRPRAHEARRRRRGRQPRDPRDERLAARRAGRRPGSSSSRARPRTTWAGRRRRGCRASRPAASPTSSTRRASRTWRRSAHARRARTRARCSSPTTSCPTRGTRCPPAAYWGEELTAC